MGHFFYDPSKKQTNKTAAARQMSGRGKQGRSHHFKSGGDGMSSVISVFFFR